MNHICTKGKDLNVNVIELQYRHTIHSKFHKQFPQHTDGSSYIRTAQNGQPLSPRRTGSQFSRPVD